MMLHQALRLCDELAALTRCKPEHFKQARGHAALIRATFSKDQEVDPELSAAVIACVDALQEWMSSSDVANRSRAPMLGALHRLRWAIEYSYDSFSDSPASQPRRIDTATPMQQAA